ANNGETPGKWIGQYVDTTEADSPTFGAYTWKKIEGPTGATGQTGASGRTYFVESSTYVIKKGHDNALSPGNVTFNAFYRDGTTATRNAYGGRFIIQETTDGTTYVTKYTSSANESSKVYSPSSSQVKTIKCVMYSSGGTTTALDTQSVVILTDVDNIQGDLNSMNQGISNAQKTADGKNTVFYQSTAPSTTGRKTNDVWFNTAESNVPYYFSGTAWVKKQFGANAIENASITNAQIANLDAAKITTGNLSAQRIVALSITGDKIAANAITAGKIAASAISAVNIASNAITTEKISASAITSAKIATDAITAEKIVANAITTAKIATAAITANEIAANAITAAKIKAGEVTSDKIATNAITAVKIAAATITADKIAANAITADKIATDAIRSRNYVINTAGTYINLADGTIDTKNFKVKSDATVEVTGKITATTIDVTNKINMSYSDRGTKKTVDIMRVNNRDGESGDGELVIGTGVPYIVLPKRVDANSDIHCYGNLYEQGQLLTSRYATKSEFTQLNSKLEIEYTSAINTILPGYSLKKYFDGNQLIDKIGNATTTANYIVATYRIDATCAIQIAIGYAGAAVVGRGYVRRFASWGNPQWSAFRKIFD
ncbi:MAG: hypothetical protein E6357_24310, partial [Clostridiales bacterium]|nr:hypothetical protein [Clostridiales bacterium]